MLFTALCFLLHNSKKLRNIGFVQLATLIIINNYHALYRYELLCLVLYVCTAGKPKNKIKECYVFSLLSNGQLIFPVTVVTDSEVSVQVSVLTQHYKIKLWVILGKLICVACSLPFTLPSRL